MPEVGTTGVVVFVPEADTLLAEAATVDEGLVRPGVPAHVALLYPFVSRAAVTPACVDQLSQCLAGLGPLKVELSQLIDEPGFVAVAAPALDPVAAMLRAEWPTVTPYGGRFGDNPSTHVSVALGTTDTMATAVRTRVGAKLPVASHVSTAHVVALDTDGWHSLVTVPLV